MEISLFLILFFFKILIL